MKTEKNTGTIAFRFRQVLLYLHGLSCFKKNTYDRAEYESHAFRQRWMCSNCRLQLQRNLGVGISLSTAKTNLCLTYSL